MTMALFEIVCGNCFKSGNPLLKLMVLRKAIFNIGSLQIKESQNTQIAFFFFESL